MGGEEPRLLGVLILRGLLLLRLLLLVLGEVRGQVEAALAAEDGEGELELEGGKHGVEASKGLVVLGEAVLPPGSHPPASCSTGVLSNNL